MEYPTYNVWPPNEPFRLHYDQREVTIFAIKHVDGLWGFAIHGEEWPIGELLSTSRFDYDTSLKAVGDGLVSGMALLTEWSTQPLQPNEPEDDGQ